MEGMLQLDSSLQKSILYFCELEDVDMVIKPGSLDVVNVVCGLCLILRQRTLIPSDKVVLLLSFHSLSVLCHLLFIPIFWRGVRRYWIFSLNLGFLGWRDHSERNSKVVSGIQSWKMT